MFDLQPTLEGPLIRLRPLLPEDFEPLHACAADPLIWEQHPQSNRHQRDIFRVFFDGALASKGAFAILDRETGRMLGSSRYYDLRENAVTVGYTFLIREVWGGRFNRELKSLMLGHAFRYVETVNFEIGETNLRSQKAIAKTGARFVERRELDGKTHLLYQVTKQAHDEARVLT